jgi:ABC-type dipeptide/oligopeptide/nickel transport system permease subunit
LPRYIVSRLAATVVMALLATLVIFLIANMVPGDPILAQLGDVAASNKAFVAEWRAKWGLDLPLWERYFIFLKGIVHGDLGISIASQRPVLEDIGQYAPATVELSTVSFLISVIIGVPLGILAAIRRDSWIDHVARAVSLIGVSSPTFWLAFIMLALFYGGLQIAPGPGRLDPIAFSPPTVTGLFLIDSLLAGDLASFRDAAAHLVLPSLVLAAATLGLITRTTRASMLDNLHQDYVRVARAKGLREGRIVNGHVLPNALIPIVTLGGLAYANLLTGAVMTETVFSWPGLGRYTFRSAEALDFPGDHGHHARGRGDLSRHQSPHRPELCAPRSEGRAVTAFDQASATLAAIAPVRTRRQRWRRRYGVAAIGAAIILIWIFVALACPLLTPYSPNAVDVSLRLQPPSEAHWLGTDELGRDVLTRLLYGTRISLVTGVVVVMLGASFGTLLGGAAAYMRGRGEELIMRLTDLVLCFPPIILALAIAAALGIGTTNTIIAMLVVWWPKFARLAHSLVLVQRSQEYVEAAVVVGLKPARILMRHIIPNAVGPLIVLVTLDIGNAIITFAGLSFLGLGVVPPTPEWGSMVAEGRELVEQWWVAAFPGFAILTVVLGFNFLGDGVRDWLDPKARQR